ncbi:NAD(P)H-dependent glycerol-3-phosphate dehydrogenase [bacterium]|jgi:glycerol-3-phosphate dehydrogenase (NAD(P)+)|nr:NAD(P)H-dependent glycerol-3-phosphate dehydrogenase [bacterium]
MNKITVIGDGSWGTAVAVLLNEKGGEVKLWGAFKDNVDNISKRRENKKFLPGIEIPAEIFVTNDIELAMRKSNYAVFAVPSHFMRNICSSFKDFIRDDTVCISLSKGIENKSLKRMSEVIEDELSSDRIAVLSGPSHAEEVSRKMPTTVVAVSGDKKIAEDVQRLFHTDFFRVYSGDDVLGVELSGALKNVIAIAAGICDSLGFGDNSKAALMTRGLAEITRLGVKMGARRETFSGLAGMGDLITTCISRYGRNLKLGNEIGLGKTLEKTQAGSPMIAEGVKTALSAVELSAAYSVEMPICSEVYNVLYKNKSPREAVRDLMTRDAKPEHF